MPSDLAMAVFFPRYCSNAGKDSKTNAGDYIGSALNEVSDSRTPPAPPNLHAFFRFGIFKSRLRQPGLTSALQTMSGPSTLAQTPSQSISVDLHNALSILLPRGRRSKKKNKKKNRFIVWQNVLDAPPILIFLSFFFSSLLLPLPFRISPFVMIGR